MRPGGPVTDGDSVTLECASSFSPVYSSYVWSVDRVDSADQAGNGELDVAVDINNVHTYSCKMSVDGGNTYSEYSNEITPKGKFFFFHTIKKATLGSKISFGHILEIWAQARRKKKSRGSCKIVSAAREARRDFWFTPP